jgi:hypothetical protein
MGDRSDPELLREAMGRYHAELRTIVERHGGTVEKFIGDAAMAVFGIPKVHGDDALRAVRAADEIRGAVGRLNLQVRIGLQNRRNRCSPSVGRFDSYAAPLRNSLHVRHVRGTFVVLFDNRM